MPTTLPVKPTLGTLERLVLTCARAQGKMRLFERLLKLVIRQ